MTHGLYSTSVKPRLDNLVLVSVLTLWAGMTSVAVCCIAIYGRNVPLAEDWYMVSPLVGQETELLKWLWAQNNEHRLPLQKAVYLGLLKASGGDFRIVMLANIGMLAGLCLAMILTARSLRGGQTRLADAFFPLALLHLGHVRNMIWAWQIQIVFSTVLVCVWLLIIVKERWPLPTKPALLSGVTLVLLPLSGANGLLFTPFFALWLAIGIFLFRTEMREKWLTPFLGACVIVSIVLIGLYFVGWAPIYGASLGLEDGAHTFARPPNPGLEQTVVAGLKFVGMAIGPVGGGTVTSKWWYLGRFFCAVTFLLLASSLIPLIHGVRLYRTMDGLRTLGLLMFAAAMAGLVLALAWGRAGDHIPGMPDYYALLSVPGLCAAYFAWILYGSEPVRNWTTTGFAIASLLALPFNVRDGDAWLSWYVAGMRSFEQDLSTGFSWQELGDKHYKFLLAWNRDALVERMRMLHDAKIGPLGKAVAQ
jgi:hypothetical protein